MKIIGLSLLIFSAFYYFWPKTKLVAEVDMLKVKSSAPVRMKKHVATNIKKVTSSTAVDSESAMDEEYSEEEPPVSGEHEENVEHFDEPRVNDIEKGWQEELREVLTKLEPDQGKEIFNAYVNEKDSQQAELDALVQESQKRGDLEYLIDELEAKHEEKVKEIFGNYYEEIKARQETFIESASSPE